MSVGEKILFSNFCELCNKISKTAKTKKSEILSKFIQDWRILGEEASNQSVVDTSFLPALRLLLPQLDRERGAYGIKENTLARIYIRILCLPPDGKDSLKLLNYRAPKAAGNQAGDFAEVAYWILKSRCEKGGELTVADVNGSLDSIAKKHAEHDPRGVDEEITHLLQCTSAEEQKWLIRIILKDMKMGMGQSLVLLTFHPDAKDMYDLCNNLTKVCDKLRDPNLRMHEIDLELFAPFRPMLSEELAIHNIEHNFNRVPYFFVETKMDGERFQVHMNQGNYKFFSRNGFEYTSNFGDTRMKGLLTPKFAKQLSSNVQSVILDGEMMAWNPNTSTFTSKGMNIDVKTLKDTSLHRPCFCVFDVLYLNEEVLTNKPLFSRLEKLEKIITPKDGVLMFVKRKRVSSKDEVFEALDAAIDDGEEGIILKEYLAVYKPNVRKNGGWFKIKPEYTDSLMDTVDLLIIGGYHGGGRHKGAISHFLLGVVSGKDEPRTFLSTARVGSGYSMDELQELQSKLDPHWQKTIPGVMPDGIEWTKDKPEFWIEPSKSVILEIKATEIVPSILYKTGYTLRFPRVKNVRYDKSWTDCTTVAEFEEKRRNSYGKLIAHGLTDAETSPQTRNKKTVRSVFQLDSEYQAADLSAVNVTSELLKGKEVCVMTDCGEIKRIDIEKKIVQFGGRVTKNPGNDTWCVLAEKDTLQVKNIIKAKRHDVVKSSWLLSLLDSKSVSIPDFPRSSLIGMSLRTESRMSRHYDSFGDHYTVPATVESVKRCIKAMSKMKVLNISEAEKAELDIELFDGENTYRLFRLLMIWCYHSTGTEVPFELILAALDFTFYGGQHSNCLDQSVTHVVCSGDMESIAALKLLRRSRAKKFHIVTPDWIKSCIEAKRRLEELH